MMKFSTLALALVAATPFVAADYACHNDAFFHLKDDDSQPSKAAIESLQSAMVDAFEEAYKNIDDIDMTSDTFETVSSYNTHMRLLSLLFCFIQMHLCYIILSKQF